MVCSRHRTKQNAVSAFSGAVSAFSGAVLAFTSALDPIRLSDTHRLELQRLLLLAGSLILSHQPANICRVTRPLTISKSSTYDNPLAVR
jgi:hypothetical protein